MAKLSIEHLCGDSYLIASPANCGLYVRDDKAILIDSGNDKESGRQIAKLIQERHWTLDMIVNTHSNADHVGGNAFLQTKTGCRIAATKLEAAFIENPFLEPCHLYGGYPPRSLRNKFLMAAPSTVMNIIANHGPIDDTGLLAMPLPGHFVDMIGVRTPDNVLFLADSLFSTAILDKYHLTYIHDLEAQLATLARLEKEQAEWFIPSHAAATRDISHLLHANRKKILQILDVILEAMTSPRSQEDILATVCATFGIALDPNQYVLLGSAVRSYLAYCHDQHLAVLEFDQGRALWSRSSSA